MRMPNPNMPRQPMVPDSRPRNPRPVPIPRKNPRDTGVPLGPDDRPLGMQPRPKPNAGGVMGFPVKPKGGGAMGLKKGGMATKKKAGMISEYGGKEMYSSKKAMMKHEGMEGMKMEKSEGKMRGGGMATKGKGVALKKGGMAKKGRGMAIMIAIGKPKGRGK